MLNFFKTNIDFQTLVDAVRTSVQGVPKVPDTFENFKIGEM